MPRKSYTRGAKTKALQKKKTETPKKDTKKAPTKKTPTKKADTKKAPTKKAPAKKTTPTKTKKRAHEDDDEDKDDDGDDEKETKRKRKRMRADVLPKSYCNWRWTGVKRRFGYTDYTIEDDEFPDLEDDDLVENCATVVGKVLKRLSLIHINRFGRGNESTRTLYIFRLLEELLASLRLHVVVLADEHPVEGEENSR